MLLLLFILKFCKDFFCISGGLLLKFGTIVLETVMWKENSLKLLKKPTLIISINDLVLVPLL